MLTVVASSVSGFGKMRKVLDERRAMLEKARNTRVKRIKQEVQRIAKREVEFTKNIMNDIVPFRLVWNEEVIQKARASMPFTFEEKEPFFADALQYDEPSDEQYDM
jgi:hypothetical protein